VGVFAVLAELDGEAVERAGVEALEEALHDELGAQVEPRDLADDLGLQILLNGGHGAEMGSGEPGRPRPWQWAVRRGNATVDGVKLTLAPNVSYD
jgi:hypothetical protein